MKAKDFLRQQQTEELAILAKFHEAQVRSLRRLHDANLGALQEDYESARREVTDRYGIDDATPTTALPVIEDEGR